MAEQRLPRIFGLWLLLLSCWAGLATARDIKVEAVSSRIDDGHFVLDAQLDVHLTDNTREALENGVTLEFELDTRLLRPRRFWWDGELLTATRRFLLSRHALADGYLLSEQGSERQQTFKALDDALRGLGAIVGFDAGRVATAVRGKHFRGRLRMRLDIEALPAPLRPIAYVSPSWRVSSGWYEWTFAR